MDATEQETATSATERVTRLEFDVEWPPNHVAAYLIEGPRPILVDAAAPAEAAADTMRETLGAAGYEPADIEAVVVTHPHSDHIGQVPLLRKAGATVYASEPTLEQLRRDAAHLRAGVHEIGRSIGLDDDNLEREADRAVDSLTRNRRLLDPDDAVGFDYEDDLTVAGIEFEPIHTPGHQIHHASLAATVGDERLLFSGDALIEPFRAAALHVGIDYGAYDAVDAFHASMDRLADRAIDRVFPGHGPVFTDYGGAIEGTRASLAALVEDTEAAVESVGPATPMAVVTERVGETDHPAHLLDTLGALGTLESRGAVTYALEDGVRYYEPA